MKYKKGIAEMVIAAMITSSGWILSSLITVISNHWHKRPAQEKVEKDIKNNKEEKRKD